MNSLIENPIGREIQAVIWFFNTKNLTAAKIHQQLCGVYGTSAMSEGKMRQWVRQLKDGQKNMHDENRGGHPSFMQDDFVEKVYNKIVKIGGSQFQSYQCVFHKFYIHYSMKVAEGMHYNKVCARWVPKVLTEEQKKKAA